MTTRSGCSFQWLPTGDLAFAAMLGAIDQARQCVRLETYIFRDDPLGGKFIQALMNACARGVHVRLLLDALGSSDLPADFFALLAAAGAHCKWFNPLSLGRLTTRDHRKMLVCDDSVAFVGGLNVSEEYAGDGVTRGWRDLGLRILGSPVPSLATAFDEMFQLAEFRHGMFSRFRKTTTTRRYSPEGCELLLSGPGRGPSPIKSSLRRDLARAREVRIYGAYFLPTWRILRQLLKIARRGGSVQLILAGKSDVPLSLLATHSLYHKLLRAGVEIYEYQPQILHAKLILIDDAVYAGSANLDTRSLDLNYELLVRVPDASLTAQARELFSQDLTRCRRVDFATWDSSRSFWTKLQERWAYFILSKLDPRVTRWQLRAMR